MELSIFLLIVCGICCATSNGRFVVERGPHISQRQLLNGGGSWNVPLHDSNARASISWQPEMSDGEDMMMFSIKGPATGYIAMAISMDMKMGPADDAYICSRVSPTSQSVKVSSGYLTGHTLPTIVGPVSMASVVNVSIEDTTMSCTFLRPLSVTKKVDGKSVSWDISTTKYNLLFAEGAVTDNGTLSYHKTNKNATQQPIDFTGQRSPDGQTSVSNANGVWNVPLPCGTNCASVQWKTIMSEGDEKIMFTMKGPSTGYLAMAISLDMKMGPADDAYICSRKSPISQSIQVSSAYLTGHAPPTIVSQVDNSLVVNVSVEDTTMSCTFLRPLTVTKKVDGKSVSWDISTTKYNLLFAEGAVTDNGTLSYHDKNKNTTQAPINFTNQTTSTDDSTSTKDGGMWNVALPCGTNCASVQWMPTMSNGVEMMIFTLKGPSTGYVAMAISSDMKMGPADDAYVCSRKSPTSQSIQVSSAYLTGHAPPTIVSQVDNSLVVNVSIEDTTMSCTFLRPLSVTKKVDGKSVSWDISTTKYNLLFAEGAVTDNGTLSYHDKNKNTTQAPISFTNQTTPTDDNTSPKDGGMWNVALPCGTNCASVQWMPTMSNGVDMMMFTLKGPSTGYVAMAISLDMKMGPADDAYVCSRKSPTSQSIQVSSAYLTGHAPPTIVSQVDNSLVVNVSIEDTTMSCTFLRPLSVTKKVDGKSVSWDISTTKYNLLFAEGAVTDNGTLSYHDKNKNTTQAPISFTNQTAPTDDSTSPKDGGMWNVALPCGTNCASVQWMPTMSNGVEMMMFTMKGPSTGYVAMAISSDMKMGPADDAYICSRKSPTSQSIQVSSAYLTGHATPTIVSQVDSDNVLNVSINEGTMSCTFLRSLSVTKKVDGKLVSWDLATNRYNLLFAEGAVMLNGSISYHQTSKNATTAPIAFTSSTEVEGSSTTPAVVITTTSLVIEVTDPALIESTTSAASNNQAIKDVFVLTLIISLLQMLQQ